MASRNWGGSSRLQIWSEVGQERPDDLPAALRLFDLALRVGDREDGKRLARVGVDRLHRIEGEDGVLWRWRGHPAGASGSAARCEAVRPGPPFARRGGQAPARMVPSAAPRSGDRRTGGEFGAGDRGLLRKAIERGERSAAGAPSRSSNFSRSIGGTTRPIA